MGFNRCISKIKELYTDIDIDLLILIDLDSESLIEEVIKGDLVTFVQVADIVLYTIGRIVDDNFEVEDDLPVLKTSNNDKGRGSCSSCSKPLRARSKATRKRR